MLFTVLQSFSRLLLGSFCLLRQMCSLLCGHFKVKMLVSTNVTLLSSSVLIYVHDLGGKEKLNPRNVTVEPLAP